MVTFTTAEKWPFIDDGANYPIDYNGPTYNMGGSKTYCKMQLIEDTVYDLITELDKCISSVALLVCYIAPTCD